MHGFVDDTVRIHTHIVEEQRVSLLGSHCYPSLLASASPGSPLWVGGYGKWKVSFPTFLHICEIEEHRKDPLRPNTKIDVCLVVLQ